MQCSWVSHALATLPNSELGGLRSLEFLVRWNGYEVVSSDSWDPMSELRDVEPLRDYVRSTGHDSSYDSLYSVSVFNA
jgi:hypothetical protein